ncbi:MAG: polynucleotide adenylyltransferase [Clostridiales bacterium]|jgi:tRNA nucleotidyltransferase (CCA-adding enzyme)|nr:polynucleotide adenylyltransferase [Clostridiales bacterium]
MRIDLPANVQYILDTLNRQGHEAYAVGGCVRDCLLGRVPHDWDIATSASPPEVKACFPRTFDTGIAHGTVTVLLRKAHYEVTTYRVDGLYLDSRHPQSVSFTKNLREDLARRDFTINAIAYHPGGGIVDPFEGARDISQKIIRGVGDPDCRFQEDALRMLRAVRFSGQLGFDIEEATERAMAKNAARLRLISAERVREELTKLLLSPYPEKITLLLTAHLLEEGWPSGDRPGDRPDNRPDNCPGICPRADEIRLAAQRLPRCPKKIALVYALLLYGREPAEVARVMESLRFDRAAVRDAAHLTRWVRMPLDCRDYPLRRFLSLCGPETFEDILALKNIVLPAEAAAIPPLARERYRAVMESGACLRVRDLRIDGNDLLALGLKGKEIGETLDCLLDHVLRRPELNQKEVLMRMVRGSP